MAAREAVIFERIPHEPGRGTDEGGVDDPQDVERLEWPAGRRQQARHEGDVHRRAQAETDERHAVSETRPVREPPGEGRDRRHDGVLEQGPAYPWEIAEFTGLAVKTVKNTLTGLRKQSVVEATGESEGRMEQVRLSVPASLSLHRDGDDSDSLDEEEMCRTDVIQSERQVFEMARERFGRTSGAVLGEGLESVRTPHR
jgi:hypothetical protein